LRIRHTKGDVLRVYDRALPDCWLIAEWPPEVDEPVNYWLSNMSTRTSLKTLIHYAKLRWRVEHEDRELKTGLGIDHFEGRSFTGWHRHVTLAVLAQAFCTLLRLDLEGDAPA
jgi:SRSO17 transposase